MADHATGQPFAALPAAGDGPLSEQRLRQIVAADPRRGDAWCQLGLMAARQGRHAVVVECLSRAAELSPDQELVHHHLALSHQALGRKEEAVRHFHRVVCLKPEFPEAHNNWGIALAQQMRRAEAIAAFSQALRLKPDFPEAHNNWGIALVEQGQLEETVDHFRQALALHPNYPEALNNLGQALGRLGRHADALAVYEQAVRHKPNYAEALHNLANLHRDQGRLDDALRTYRQVLQARADHRDARLAVALTLARQGQTEEAIAALHQSLLFHPDSHDAYNHLGVLLCQRDRLDEGAASFRNALRLRPDFAEALNNLGNTLLRQQKTDEAVSCFMQALDLRRDYPQPYCNLGSALMQQGKAAEAVGHYLEAVRLQPDYIDAHFNLGNAYRTLGRGEEAVACYQRVLALQPDNAGARLNMGVVLSEQGQLDEAIAVYQEVLRQQPDFVQVYNSMGVTRLHQGRVSDGVACFEEGLRRKPDDAEIHLNRALSWLLLGDFDAGFVEYEWRWKLKKSMPCSCPQPTWDGAALPEGTILLWAEQGLGDTLQFIRFASLVKQRVGKVLLDCPGPLRGLLVGCPGIDGLTGGGAPLPPIDVQAPLLSLPRILGTTLSNIPAATPYLFTDAALRDLWREKIGSAKGLKVGLNWQGNPQFAGDRYRSVALAKFRALADVPGVQLFSLQKGKGAEQLTGLGEELRITDLAGQITGDFRDTAAAIANLDLVVSVDTAVAHLAGALGVPVWILLPFNPDWRWLQEREDSVWYPSARLFRQSRWGDWDDVFARVARALREQTLRPLRRRVSIEMNLVELVERAVREELHPGRAEESWAALRQAGLPDTEGVGRLVQRLKAAHEAIAAVDREMRGLGSGTRSGKRAATLVRRYARAQQERTDALAEFSGWLAGADPAAGTTAEPCAGSVQPPAR